MFGARKGAVEGEPIQETALAVSRSEAVQSPARTIEAPATRTTAAQIPVTPRRVIDIPAAARRGSHPLEIDTRSNEGSRTLKVGKGLSVAGAEPVGEMVGIARVVRHGQFSLSSYIRVGAIPGQGPFRFDQPGGAVG